MATFDSIADFKDELVRKVLAGAALTAAAYEFGVFGNPGFDNLGFKVTAKRTFHECPQLIFKRFRPLAQ